MLNLSLNINEFIYVVELNNSLGFFYNLITLIRIYLLCDSYTIYLKYFPSLIGNQS